MKIAIAQTNPVIADIAGNRAKLISFIERAKSAGADLVVFPELATIGYPPMDLLENHRLIDDNLVALDTIAAACTGIAAVCGYVDYDRENRPMLFNSAAFMAEGRVLSRHHKTLLPTYDVFDELRYFAPARAWEPVAYRGRTIGITICEDIWNDLDYEDVPSIVRKYPVDPVKRLIDAGIDLLISINASPYVRGKNSVKWGMISAVARKNAVPVVYVNQTGGNDSLIFDGNSFMVDAQGVFSVRAARFAEDLVVVDDDLPGTGPLPREEELEDIRLALVMGLRDYVVKCGFKSVVLGLSGGIDSALTAALAVQALGKENVMGITMPSPYSSQGSVDDSIALARNLGFRVETLRIDGLYRAYREMLSGIFAGLSEDVAEENIQARIRGNLLMAVSNKFGSLLLTTGNKSELAMGYCTLYGDMSGGLAVLSDLPKTLVYRLAEHVNHGGEIIPRASIEKAPSAELRPNQKDQDSLPPYDILDGILERYIERAMSADEIIADGFSSGIVRDILTKVDRNEYKRRQAPPGLKVTTKAFGIGRRIPMAQRFRQ
ncbi:MAG: NAD+ synthase [Spirochaetes bacterium]|jgi:NAD+ synthase (glutamine-hydrolysing)|nr:NAD+ synthase [Spirochaetota bacterium]